MEKGDKKKVKPKKKTQQKQKQKQEQNVIVNITQPVKKQRKRVYKPTKKIIVTQPIRNITNVTQIPTERAELYRQVQQPTIGQQAPQPQAPAQAQAQAPVRAEIKAPVFTKPKVTVEEEPLRAESKFIFEDPLISSSSMLYPEQNLELIKSKYKKVRPLEDYMSDISEANSRAEVKHEAEIFNNPNFYDRNIYDEEKEAEKIDEIDVGEPAGFSSVPIFTSDNLFNERVEAEKIDEFHPLTIISKIGEMAEKALGGGETEEQTNEYLINKMKENQLKDMEEEKARQEMKIEREIRRAKQLEEEKIKDAERQIRNEKERAMIATGLYKLEAGKWVLKDPEMLQPIQQEGGDLMPTIQTGLEVGGGGEMVGIASEDLMEKRGGGGRAMEKGEGKFTKDMIIDIRQNYINILNESGDPQGIADAQQKQLDKYKDSTKNQSDTALKSMFYDYQKKLSTINEMYEMYKQMEEGEELY
jgi:hypothetical protein